MIMVIIYRDITECKLTSSIRNKIDLIRHRVVIKYQKAFCYFVARKLYTLSVYNNN